MSDDKERNYEDSLGAIQANLRWIIEELKKINAWIMNRNAESEKKYIMRAELAGVKWLVTSGALIWIANQVIVMFGNLEPVITHILKAIIPTVKALF